MSEGRDVLDGSQQGTKQQVGVTNGVDHKESKRLFGRFLRQLVKTQIAKDCLRRQLVLHACMRKCLVACTMSHGGTWGNYLLKSMMNLSSFET